MAGRRKLGELLVEAGAVRESDVRNALGQQKAMGGGARIGELLVANVGLQRSALAQALAAQADLPFIQLPEISAQVAALVPSSFLSEHKLVPFRLEQEGKSERLHLAIADPSKLDVVDELRFNLRKTLRIYVAAEDDIDHALAVLRGEKVEEIETIEGVEEPLEEVAVEVERSPTNIVGWIAQGQAEAKSVPDISHEVDLELTPAPAPPPKEAQAPDPVRSAAADLLDDLLGDMVGKAPAPAPGPAPRAPEEKQKPAGVVEGVAITRFARRDTTPKEKFEFSEQDLHVLDNLERMATGQESVLEGEKVRPERMVAALIRLLIRRGLIHELEFLEELARK